MSEILFVILLVGGFLIPTAVTRNWWLFKVFVIFFVCFGLVEWWATSTTDMSVSQHFWAYSESHTVMAWVVLGGMLVAWLALLAHLGKKLITRGKK